MFNGYHTPRTLYTVVSGGGSGSTVGMSNSYMYGARLAFTRSPTAVSSLAGPTGADDRE